MSKILIEKKTFKKVFFHIIGGRMSFRLRLLNIIKIINLEIILMFNYNLTDRIRKNMFFLTKENIYPLEHLCVALVVLEKSAFRCHYPKYCLIIYPENEYRFHRDLFR